MLSALIGLAAFAGASNAAGDGDYEVRLALSGRGLTSEAVLTFENRLAAEELTFVVEEIALSGECTGYSARKTVGPGTDTLRVTFRRSTLTPVTVCDAGVTVLSADGSVLEDLVLTAAPYGDAAVRRLSAAGYPDATVALDNDLATLLILTPDSLQPSRRVLWLYNKSDRLLRLHIDRALADGQLTGLSVALQALPQTAQYGEIRLPDALTDTLTMSLAGYLAGQDKQPAFRAVYDYRPQAPVSVPTVVPKNTPRPEIGTVTIRKSGPVNVREGDSTDAKKVGSAKAGATYPCYGISDAGWYLIRLEDGTEGYITNPLTTFQPR